MSEYDDLGDLALLILVLRQRLDRIEKRLGITEPTPAQAEQDRRINQELT